MLLRVIAALMFAAAGAVGGFSRADALKSDLELCRETVELLRKSSILIRFQGLNVLPQICADLHFLTICLTDFPRERIFTSCGNPPFHVRGISRRRNADC